MRALYTVRVAKSVGSVTGLSHVYDVVATRCSVGSLPTRYTTYTESLFIPADNDVFAENSILAPRLLANTSPSGYATIFNVGANIRSALASTLILSIHQPYRFVSAGPLNERLFTTNLIITFRSFAATDAVNALSILNRSLLHCAFVGPLAVSSHPLPLYDLLLKPPLPPNSVLRSPAGVA